MLLRPATVEDQPGVIALIDTIFREYGDVVHLPGADADLLDLAGNYEDLGGAFRVLDDGGRVRGTVAMLQFPNKPGVGYLRRFYLENAMRGSGWGTRMIEWALGWAREQGFRRIELWSDTRFTRAHAFFTRIGFHRGEQRTMTDGAMPYHEHFFSLDLDVSR